MVFLEAVFRGSISPLIHNLFLLSFVPTPSKYDQICRKVLEWHAAESIFFSSSRYLPVPGLRVRDRIRI